MHLSSPSADLFQMYLYGSASAEPFLLPAFPENWGARLRISGGCPARGEPEALTKLCSSIACRAQPCQRCSPVLQALIIFQMQLYGSASAEPFFAAPFPENRGARLRISGGCPARGEPEALTKLCSSIACRAQPCQRCSPVLQALIIFQMQLYGSASAEPFFAAPFPENGGARLRISGGCPARGEPETLKIFAQASRAKTKSMGLRLFCKLFMNPIDKVGE